jgi:glycosyltransferase involved in cell wall biosynthesis
VIFDSMDAEHVRLARKLQVISAGTEDELLATRLRERFMVGVSDVVVAVTEQDLCALQALDPSSNARGIVVPNLYDLSTRRPPHTGGDWDAVFVGGFVHEPNVDAVRWLVQEICPLLNGQLRICIVGHGLPAPFVTMARAAGMTYLGGIDDLAAVYSATKVAIAPLRFGSGIKGKVIEAALHGLPVVGTCTAWEGIEVQNGVSGVIADDASTFAEAICGLTIDEKHRLQVAQASQQWLAPFSVDVHRRALLSAVRPGV